MLPLRRTDQLTVQHVGEETLLYDKRTHQAYCLHAVAARVWSLCDGHHTAADLAAAICLESDKVAGEAVVHTALAQLTQDDLITGYQVERQPLLSRRQVLTGTGAGITLALPLIAMISAPKAAQAYSGCFDCSNSPAAARRQHMTQQGSQKHQQPAGFERDALTAAAPKP